MSARLSLTGPCALPRLKSCPPLCLGDLSLAVSLVCFHSGRRFLPVTNPSSARGSLLTWNAVLPASGLASSGAFAGSNYVSAPHPVPIATGCTRQAGGERRQQLQPVRGCVVTACPLLGRSPLPKPASLLKLVVLFFSRLQFDPNNSSFPFILPNPSSSPSLISVKFMPSLRSLSEAYYLFVWYWVYPH